MTTYPPYSSVDDLLIGGVLISDTVKKEQFVQDAADDIHARLGFIYELPFNVSGAGDNQLPIHQVLLLKQINNKLASGRLYLTLDAAGEQSSLHAYGLRLVTEAMNDLMLLANGNITLDSPLLTPETDGDRVAGIYNHDEESAVTIFEDVVFNGVPSYWNPGEVRSRIPALGFDSHRLTD